MDGIGDRIRVAREAAGLSQAKLGEIAGANQQSVDRIERGAVSYSKHLPAILSVLGLNVPADVPDKIARVREAERLRIVAQDLKAKAADLEAMAARLERG